MDWNNSFSSILVSDIVFLPYLLNHWKRSYLLQLCVNIFCACVPLFRSTNNVFIWIKINIFKEWWLGSKTIKRYQSDLLQSKQNVKGCFCRVRTRRTTQMQVRRTWTWSTRRMKMGASLADSSLRFHTKSFIHLFISSFSKDFNFCF